MSVEIRLVDVAAHARRSYGAAADAVTGRRLPRHDWRFELVAATWQTTMHRGATADDVANYLAREEVTT